MIGTALMLGQRVLAWLPPLAGLAAAATILWMRGALIEARADQAALTRALATAEATIARAAATAAVHRAHIDRMAREAADHAALTRDLQSMEGRDAPLSDHMRAAGGRLWP